MPKADAALAKIRDICLSLPDTKETPTWGSPHFRVGEKIFAGYGEHKGVCSISFKLEMEHADLMVQDARFWRAPYVGNKGWVSTDPSKVRDWEEIRLLVLESYRLIAPKRSLAKLEAGATRAKAITKKSAKKRAAAKRAPSAKKAASKKAIRVTKKSAKRASR